MSFDDIEIDIIEEDIVLEFPDLGIDLLVPVPPTPSVGGGEVDPADIAAAVEQYFIANPNNSVIPVPAVANLIGLVRPANDLALVGENKTFYISTGSDWNEWINFSGGSVDPADVTALIEEYIEAHPYPDVSNFVESDDPRLTDARPPTPHAHDIEDVNDLPSQLFNIFTMLGEKLDGTEVGALISTAIDALVDGAPGAVDTFLEVSQLLADHDDEFAALLTLVNNKVSTADLATALAGKANTVHTHSASQITTGTLDPARLPGLSLAGLNDVDVTADPPAGDDVLAWDPVSGKWTPAKLSADPPGSDAGKTDFPATNNHVPVRDVSGAQSSIRYTSGATGYTIAYRTEHGQIGVAAPTDDSHAVNRGHLNTAVSTHDASGTAHSGIRALIPDAPVTPSGAWRNPPIAFVNNQAPGANTAYVPLFGLHPQMWNGIGLVVQVAEAVDITLSIYADSNGYPGSKLVDAGVVSGASTGVKVATIASTALPMNVWLAASSPTTGTLRLHVSSHLSQIGMTWAHSSPLGADITAYRAGYRATNTLHPATAPSGMSVDRYLTLPGLRAS